MVVMWIIIGFVKVISAVLGLVMVPIGVRWFLVDQPISREGEWHDWQLLNLEGIFWPWGNDRDGALGDPNKKWFLITHRKFGKHPTDYYCMVRWLMARNPANNLMRYTKFLAVNTATSVITVLAGSKSDIDDDKLGWQWLKANDGFLNYYKFEWTFKLKDKTFHVLLGHKFDIRHRLNFASQLDESGKQKAWKGSTWRIRLVD